MAGRRFLVLFSAVCLFAGPPATKAAEKSPSGERATGNGASPKEVRLRVTDWEGVQELVGKRRGKVVLVNIWTTTCPICTEEFPHFVELAKELSDGAACITVNCDYDGIAGKPPKYYRPQVEKFLAKHPGPCQHMMLNVSLLDFLEKVELSSTPAVYVYGPEGKLAKRFDADDGKEFSLADVEKLARRLMGRRGK